MKITPRTSWLALLVVLVIALGITLALASRPQAAGPQAAGAAAASADAPRRTPALFAPVVGSPAPGATPVPPKLLAASTVNQFSVTNEQGMLLGQLENVVVDLDTGSLAYAFMQFGRDPATMDQFYAVPFTALELNRQQQGFILHGAQKIYTGQPSFSRQSLANGAVLPGDFHPVFGSGDVGATGVSTPVPGETPIPTPAVGKGPLVLLPQLMGWEVWNGNGQRLGVIQDFPIDGKAHRVTWAILALGNALSADKKLTPVPLAALKLDAAHRHFNLDIQPDTLQAAPTFTQDNWPDMSQPGWDAQSAAFWRQRGQWRP